MGVKESIASDGSVDYGNGVIGPSAADVEFFNSFEDLAATIEPQEKKPRGSSHFVRPVLLLVDLVPKPLQKPVQVALLTTAAGLGAGAVCGEEVKKTSQLQPHLEYSLALPFAAGETWWYTGGPHYDGLSGGVKYAVDFSPTDKALKCPDSEPYRLKFVRAIADGVVAVSGNEKDKKDKNHSIVEVDHSGQFTSGYMHLADIQVEVGEEVKQGDPLGYASCEIPPGGSTGGIHVHEYGKEGGEPIEVDRLVMSGWTIEGTGENYQGTMTKSGEDTRVADVNRCGPQTYSIRQCNGLRNDIAWGNVMAERAPTIAPVPTIAKVPTIAPVPTLAPVPTVRVVPTVKVEPTSEVLDPLNPETRKKYIQKKIEEGTQLTYKFVNLLLSGKSENIQAAFNMQEPPSLQREPYKSAGYYNGIAPLADLIGCSEDMQKGQLQNLVVKFHTGSVAELTQAEILNRQRGIGKRDLYMFGTGFVFREFNFAAHARVDFKDYAPINHNWGLVFEDVDGILMVISTLICNGSMSPVNVKSYD